MFVFPFVPIAKEKRKKKHECLKTFQKKENIYITPSAIVLETPSQQ